MSPSHKTYQTCPSPSSFMILTEVRGARACAATSHTPYDHHVEMDDENEGRGQPGPLVVFLYEIEALKVPVNIRVLLNFLEGEAVRRNGSLTVEDIGRSVPRFGWTLEGVFS